MNIEQVAQDHPELLTAILAASSGPLGEVLVARELRKRGCEVSILSNNWRQRDLQVRTPAGEGFFVETKTVRLRGAPWWVNSPPDPTRSRFWILVTAPREAGRLPADADVTFHVLAAEEALAAWKQGPVNPKVGDLRLNRLPQGALGAFHKLGL